MRSLAGENGRPAVEFVYVGFASRVDEGCAVAEGAASGIDFDRAGWKRGSGAMFDPA